MKRPANVFRAVETRADLYPVKPWAVECSVAPDMGVPQGRGIHWCWTKRGAVGAADYLNRLLREDLGRWLEALPSDGRAGRPLTTAAGVSRRGAVARRPLDPGEHGEVAQHVSGRRPAIGAV